MFTDWFVQSYQSVKACIGDVKKLMPSFYSPDAYCVSDFVGVIHE